MVKVAILGLGSRGATTYGDYLITLNDVKISAICDIDKDKLNFYQNKYHVEKKDCFLNSEDFFKAGKLADILIIATMDQDHYSQAMKALDLKYHLLLEKPIALNLKQCLDIENKALKNNLYVVVCHVLRYSLFYKKIKEIVNSKILGNIININTTENVGYWHQAHSFVRGNWNNSNKTSPMILQKCCHDFDILNWIIDKKPLNVSSFGSLSLFKKENAPKDSSNYCYDCKIQNNCPYNAVKYYVDSIKNDKDLGWPYDVVVLNPTKDKVLAAIKNGPYGRCVYKCDNNVVDHQIVNIQYEDNITATHTMCAFSKDCYRDIKIFATRGDLIANTLNNTIIYHTFVDNKEFVIDVSKLTNDLSGHMGGDKLMINEFLKLINKDTSQLDSSIEKSVLSHVIAFAAEKSRINKGVVINLNEFKSIQ